MNQHNRDLCRQELDSAREAEYDARSFEEAWARAAAEEPEPEADVTAHDRLWWAGENAEFHAEPPAPRYHVEPWDVAPGWCRIVDSRYDAVVSHHIDLDSALRTIAVLNHPAFDVLPTDPDPAGEARGGLAGHDA